SSKISDILPDFVNTNLQEGFRQFGKQMNGYLTNEAVVHAPESRSSSPVRIPRDRETYQHPQIKGLFPCGEGAGYAGGIISAAIDGMKCAEKC
ncbi:MAG: FAD-binding protein, partial [Flavobacteriales bacterium]|nr:FAD-binding protein [Flavobacteriales bacterium]